MSSFLPDDVHIGNQAVTGGGGVFYGVSGDNALAQAVHVQWDAAFIGTITLWVTNFPENGKAAVALNSVVAGDWGQRQLVATNTEITPAAAGSLAAGSLTIAGGNAGCAIIEVPNSGTHRMRVQVVCTQAGALRIRAAGKR